MENKFNVRETVEAGLKRPSFIKAQGVDSEAAFQRMTITKRMLGEYQTAINSTNTADVIGNLKEMYDDVEMLAKAIIKEEQFLISLGE